jgi:protein-tyrosine phosphatase
VDRTLRWPDCRNVRDLGGLPTIDGGRIRYRAGGVLVHCAAGKDRTGVHVALALRVAGVGVDDIAADYALSPDCTPEIIVETLGVIEGRHGSVPAYLRSAGVTGEHLTELRKRLREDG